MAARERLDIYAMLREKREDILLIIIGEIVELTPPDESGSR